MKKNKLNNKLSLTKETISKLNPNEMDNVKGGQVFAGGLAGMAETTYSMCLKSATFKCNTKWTCPAKPGTIA